MATVVIVLCLHDVRDRVNRHRGTTRWLITVTMVDTRRLILIRHAMPEIDPQVPAERWHLEDEGRAAARSLRPLMAQPAYYIASTEPKAVETLHEIAGDLDVHVDSGFAEVGRPHVWRDDDDYRALARAYVDGVRREGWEAHNQVIHRFEVAVARHAAIAAARNSALVIGTHGLAPTIWLASRCPLRPSPRQFWQALRFPDVIEVDLTSGTVSRF